MKITIISPVFPYPRRGDYFGLERYVENLAVYLKKLQHDVTVITTYWNGGKHHDNYKGVSIIRLMELKSIIGPISSIGFLHYITFGFNLYRKKNMKYYLNSDIVILNIPLAFTRFFKLKNIPVVSIFHHYVPIKSIFEYLYFPMYHFLEKWQFRTNKKVIAISEASKNDLIKYYGLNGQDIKVIPDGIDTERFNPKNNSKEIKKEFGDKLLLFSGLMIYRKRVPILLEAMTHVIKEIPDAKLILTGRGPFLKTWIKLSKNLNLHENVKFLGFVDDELLLKLYASADIFVFPSELEGFGQVLLEAMASGTPVICAEQPPMSEIIENGGLTFKINDPIDLANKIIYLLKNKEELDRLRKHGLEIVKKFHWLNIARCYEKYLFEIRNELINTMKKSIFE
ncbi:MAG: glycosyltransferase family 4 protein [Promethearchaeota archaeon]